MFNRALNPFVHFFGIKSEHQCGSVSLLNKFVILLWLAACTIIFSSSVFAQSSGEITGTVTDPNAAIVAGAQVKLTNVATNATLTTTTSDDGVYRFANVQPGRFFLLITSPNFSEARVSDVVVEVSRTTRIDVPLQLTGVGNNEVVITAGTQLLDSESGTKGQIIDSRQIENLPLQTRNPLSLATLATGVVAAGGGTTTNRQGADGTAVSSNYVINGGVRTLTGGFNEFIVDGISITNRRDGIVLTLPTSDSVQQFQVQSGGMSAEYGHTVGGVINYATKSGANAFHGNLFEFNRNTSLNARRAIPAVGDKPVSIYNQFGGSISGPIFAPTIGEGGPTFFNGRDRAFFFFSYDGSRWVRRNPVSATVPTARMRNGDFGELSTPIYDPASSATPASRTRFTNNVIPTARFNAIGKQILDLFPLPNVAGLANNYQSFNRVFTPVDNYTGRFDFNLTETQRVAFRFARVDSISESAFPLGDVDLQSQNLTFPSRNYIFSYDNTISSSLVYSARVGFTNFRRVALDPSGNTIGAAFFGYTVNPAPSGGIAANRRPLANFEIYRGLGSGTTDNQLAENFQVNQILSIVRGKHTFRVGADVRRYVAGGFITGGAPNGSLAFSALQTSNGASNTGDSAASLLLGLANTALFQQVPDIQVRNFTPAFFVNDDFKIASNLTLNLGLRYEFEGKIRERDNQVAYFDTTTINPIVNRPGILQYAGLNGNSRDITSGDYNNIGPRVGFAYVPKFDKGKSVLRGAFGIYYSPIPSIGFFSPAPGFETTLNPLKANATAAALVLTNSYTLPTPAGPLGPAASLGVALSQPIDRNIKAPTIYQWNIGMQRELAKNFVFEILYGGNRGTHLFGSQNINLPSQTLVNQAIAAQQASGTAGAAQAFLNQTIANPLAGLVPGTLGAATITRANASVAFPQYGSINTYLNNRDSVYHSLQTKVERRLSNNVNFLVSYTFSKEIDNLFTNVTGDRNQGLEQNPYDLRDSRAVGSFDRTHNFAGNIVYTLPFGKNRQFLDSGWLSSVIGGFQLTGIITAQSGIPIAVTQSTASGLPGGSRPDILANAEELNNQVRGRVNSNGTIQWLNPAAYVTVNGRYGSAPIRDAHVRGPKFYQVDLGLQRDFKFTERVFLRFRAEAFNLLNHTNLGFPEQNISSPAFGQISSVYDPRIIQFGFELKF